MSVLLSLIAIALAVILGVAAFLLALRVRYVEEILYKNRGVLEIPEEHE